MHALRGPFHHRGRRHPRNGDGELPACSARPNWPDDPSPRRSRGVNEVPVNRSDRKRAARTKRQRNPQALTREPRWGRAQSQSATPAAPACNGSTSPSCCNVRHHAAPACDETAFELKDGERRGRGLPATETRGHWRARLEVGRGAHQVFCSERSEGPPARRLQQLGEATKVAEIGLAGPIARVPAFRREPVASKSVTWCPCASGARPSPPRGPSSSGRTS